MSAPASAAQILQFDIFELDCRAGQLRKGGVKLRLRGQPLQVLTILLERAGDVVTLEELRAQIWPADTFVDFDHSLHNAINRIRETLGDSAETPRYIETLPRRGYRFIARVEDVHSPAENIAPAAETVTNTTRPKWRANAVLAVVCSCVIGLAAWMVWQRFSVRAAGPPIRSIAVLPMQNLSGDAAQDYFADGMTEELITELSRIQALRVISRTSVMDYKGTKKHLPQIAHELGVDGIVEGSVRREGDQMRVTVQLLDAPHDRHLWSEDYQRPVHGILALQGEVARAIAQQIRIQLSPEQQARLNAPHAVNPEAYEAYLRGRYYLNTQFSTEQPLNAAKGYFEESIRKDPDFAQPYAGLADTYVLLAGFRHISPERASRLVREASRQALERDDSIGEAHATLGMLHWQYEWDWAAAERELNYALAVAPSYDCAHAYQASYLAWRGRRAEALAEVTKSRELNPGSSFASEESAVYYLLRDYPALVEASRKGVASDPNEWLEHYFLGVGYEGTGKRAEAIPEYQKAIEMSHGDQDPTAALAHAYAVTGKRAEADKLLRELTHNSNDAYVSPYMIATVYAGLGNKDKAFEFLEKAFRERCLDIVWYIKVDQRIDNLRSDPRFQSLLRQVNLPQ